MTTKNTPKVITSKAAAPKAAAPKAAAPKAAAPKAAAPKAAAPKAAAPKAAAHVVTNPEPKVQRESRLLRNVLAILGVIALVLIIAFAFLGIRNQVLAGNQPSVVSNPPAVSSSADVLSESTILVLGPLGSYHAVYDNNVDKWTLGIWEETQVTTGELDLADLKIKGGTIEFVMPFDGYINNTAGTVKVNNQAWTLGNPIQDSSGNTLVAKGSLVTISYGENNSSAGFQLWFNK